MNFGLSCASGFPLDILLSSAETAFPMLMLDGTLLGDALRWPSHPACVRRYLAMSTPEPVFSLAPEAPPALGIRLLDFLGDFFACAEREKILAVKINCQFGENTATPDRLDRFRLFLKQAACMAEQFAPHLAFTFRLPCPAMEEKAGTILALMREMPSRKTALCLEIHPHEPESASIPHRMLHRLGYETDMVEFVYEPGLGNRLVPVWLNGVLDAFPRYHLPQVFFRPEKMGPELAQAELASLSALAGSLRTQENP